MNYAAAILAGGEGSRFGADKAMADLGGKPMIAHVVKAFGGAVRIAVVGNARAATLLAAADLCDPADAVRGPLAGVLAGLEWAEALGA
ncbi:MAG TPA: molybdenum cofactor guanylyltransferase MobA, partial [Hyphomonadaceae bacterium]|nr:molybdenum cofactor guanylyltransferase MobA [Hyphomonadaceae bacterium]